MVLPMILIVIGLVFLVILEEKTHSVSGGASVSIRTDHIFASLKMWLSEPLFGGGFLNDTKFYGYSTYDQGYSVGLPVFLAMQGIVM